MKALGWTMVVVAICGCGEDAATTVAKGNAMADASAEGGHGGSSGAVGGAGAGGANGGVASGGTSFGGEPDADIPECDGPSDASDEGCVPVLEEDPWAGTCGEMNMTDASLLDGGGLADDGGVIGDDGGVGDGGLASVAGQWCGIPGQAVCQGDETGYLVAEQTGSTVAGQFCEREGVDCSEIHCGTVQANELTFYYAFLEEGVWYRVDGAFTASANGQQLVGTLRSSKCLCTLNRTLHRMQ